jgi:flavin-dependent dehydrogenase
MFEINVSAEKGYAWAFPSKGNLLNIGIGVPVSIFKKDKLDINKLLDNFVSELERQRCGCRKYKKAKIIYVTFCIF